MLLCERKRNQKAKYYFLKIVPISVEFSTVTTPTKHHGTEGEVEAQDMYLT